MAAVWPLISSLPFPPVPGWIGLAGGVRPSWPLTSAGLCCWRLSVDIIVQFFLAGLGVLDNPVFFSWHATLGGVVGLLPLVLVAVGAFGRVPRRTLWLTAAVFALVVLQSALIDMYRYATGSVRAIAALHVVNALLIFWTGLKLLERTVDTLI